ncbi:retrovirus-related pol polyprotein from transposon TNT 1-94 [Tanacetum coccineum]
MAKALPTQAWLWHRRLSHLNFDYINLLSKKDVVIGLPKLKYVKDQLCSSCEVSKAKQSSFKSKTVPSSKGRLNFLHMDLCGPMRVASINGKKYISVIVNDYSRYTWTLFLRSKDETPEVLKDFLTRIQRNLQAPVISVRTDKGTEFLNKTLNAFFKEEGIEHQTSTPRTPEQNGIVERCNRSLGRMPTKIELTLEQSQQGVSNDVLGSDNCSLTKWEQQVVSEPQLVDKKGGSYAAIAPKLESGKFNKWKKRMLYYLAGMEPYYLKCIKDGPFQPKIVDGDAKPESQWTPDERRVVVQDQRLKSNIMSCLPDDIMESVISYVSAKETWTDLVHSFEGPSNTKENRIIDLKLEYQTFKAKSTESLSQTYTCYKTLLNKLANDGVNLSKHEINVDIYGRFVYEENLIQRRFSDTKKALIKTPSSTTVSTAFFSNKVIPDFQENSNDEVNERSSHFARDCLSKTSEPSYKSPVDNYSSVYKGFQPKFTPKLIQSSSNSSSQTDLMFQKDSKAEYKKMKAKLALLEESPSSS